MNPMMILLLVCLSVLGPLHRAIAQTETKVLSLIILEEHYSDAGLRDLAALEGNADYANLLRQQGGIIQSRSYRDLTKEQVRNALTTISTPTLLFFFRGQITRSATTNRVYLLPVDARADDLESYISISELNQWMKGIPEQILLLDTYTQDTDLMAYYANREMIGTSALISIQKLDDPGVSLLEMLVAVLNDPESDEDDNRQLLLQEIYQAMNARFPHPGILAPTGDMEVAVVRFPSRLYVKTEPAGAQVWVNDQPAGVTPYIRENVSPNDYQVRLELEGFYRPAETSLKITSGRGEGANLDVELERIRIRGKTHDEQGRGIVPTIVQIRGTSRAVEANENGEFVFEDAPLEVGKQYVLEASAGDGIFIGEQTFTYGGFDDIQQDILMHQRPWIEVAQERFRKGQIQDAADKFQLAVNQNYELPSLEPAFAQMALEYTEEWIQQEPNNVNAILAAAQLAERQDRRSDAKKYWILAKRRAGEDSKEYQFAAVRLKALTPWKNYILIGGAILLILIAVSAGYFMYRHKGNGNSAS